MTDPNLVYPGKYLTNTFPEEGSDMDMPTPPTQAQIEAAAKAIYNLPVNWRANKPIWEQARYQYTDEAKAALTAAAEVGEPMSRTVLEIRTEERYVTEIATIERCAQVAENYQPGAFTICAGIAAAIRAMKDQP